MTLRVSLLKLGTVNKEGLSIEKVTGDSRLGCLSSLGSQRKVGLGDRFIGLAWYKLPLPIAPLITSLRVPQS